MKYLLSALGLIMALYFGALPAVVPGQPNHRTAQLRRHRWLPASWGVRWGGLLNDYRHVPVFKSHQAKSTQTRHWVDDAQRCGTAWARNARMRIRGHIMSLLTDARHAVAKPLAPIAATRGSRSKAPQLDMVALNQEYATLLTNHRRRAVPTAPSVEYDAGLYPGCHAFNQELERGDSLYHSPTQPRAELCGFSSELKGFRSDPKRLSNYILTKFDQSPRHALIQNRPDLIWVALSVSERYFVVRLNSVPSQ